MAARRCGGKKGGGKKGVLAKRGVGKKNPIPSNVGRKKEEQFLKGELQEEVYDKNF